jgi:hypothetical protein
MGVLLELARHAASLRVEPGLAKSGSAHLFPEACREHSDLDNTHTLGPRRLAERLLEQLAEEPPNANPSVVG